MVVSNKGYNENDKTPMTFLWKADEELLFSFTFYLLLPSKTRLNF